MNTSHRAPATDGQHKTGAADTPRPLDAGAVTKRLQQELMSLMVGGDQGISAFPDGDSLFSWGGAGTVYEGLTFRLSFRFTSEYPFKPPTVRFETPCFHPNVDQYGNICLDILKDKWSAAHSVRTLLVSIQSLLSDPNVDSPLNAHAAKLWGSDQEYKQMVHKTYNGPKAS
ncbi:hypothetical protein N2152v2_005758 [Parachlorella kessleri]